MEIQKIITRFTHLIYRQFNCCVEFVDLLSSDFSQKAEKEMLEAVLQHKTARLIIFDNDLIIPITKENRIYAYVRFLEGITLHPDQVEQIQMLTDLLIRSVVIAQYKKQMFKDMENFLKDQIRRQVQEQNQKTPDKKFQATSPFSFSDIHPKSFKQPILILARVQPSAEKYARHIHFHSQAVKFLPILEFHQDHLKSLDFISCLGNNTIYIPEVTTLSLDVQKVLEEYLDLQSLSSYQHKPHSPRLIVSTTKTIQNLKKLVDKNKIRKNFLRALSQSKITMPPNEFCHKDIQAIADYLFHNKNFMKNVICFKPKKSLLNNTTDVKL